MDLIDCSFCVEITCGHGKGGCKVMCALHACSVCLGVVIQHWIQLPFPQVQILRPPVLFAAANVFDFHGYQLFPSA